jgi:hypothetical protein
MCSMTRRRLCAGRRFWFESKHKAPGADSASHLRPSEPTKIDAEFEDAVEALLGGDTPDDEDE